MKDHPMTNIEQIASLMQKLTYSEMMEIADYFAGWMAGGDISSDHMAQGISDWAAERAPDQEPQ